MKILLALAIIELYVNLVFGAETISEASKVSDPLQSTCEYKNTLTVISSPNHKTLNKENCDSEYNKSEWQEEPKVSFQKANKDKTYTLLCVDPDPPSYKDGQYWLHWLVSNIKGGDFINGDLTKAKHLKRYNGPAPPSRSGIHRYIFFAFEEKKSDVSLKNPSGRSKFNLKSWLTENSDISGPVAGMQFRSQY